MMSSHSRHKSSHLHLVPSSQTIGELGDVVVLREGSHTHVILHGNVDFRISDELEQAGRFCLDEQRPVVVDVRRVEMIDSIGVSLIVRLGAGMLNLGHELVLRGPCRRLAELLAMVGADSFVRWLPDEPAVLQVEPDGLSPGTGAVPSEVVDPHGDVGDQGHGREARGELS